jgi:glyoxylase-like metal-dependent hydrolase (beta-lactamase superfamily II)
MLMQNDFAQNSLAFDRHFPVEQGKMISVSPLVRRMVAKNPSAFTHTGTCTYVIGRGQVAIIDPGPDDSAHIASLLIALRGETITHIFVTHTHKDHSPAAHALRWATGALVVGCGHHRMSRISADSDQDPMDASADKDYRPDLVLRDGDIVSGAGWTLEAIATPGHTANHMAYALIEEKALFSGDHVMGWSTTIIAPPDGNMMDYMSSLDKLVPRDDLVYWPGHGGPVHKPQRFVQGLSGDRRINDMTPLLYQGLAPNLQKAAALSVLAHLEDMVRRGLARTDGRPSLEAEYRLVAHY